MLISNYVCLSGADCVQLSAPALGQIEGYRRETGSTVRVSCNTGYKVYPDISSFRTCQGDKQWSGADPTCKSKICFQQTLSALADYNIFQSLITYFPYNICVISSFGQICRLETFY